MARKSLPPKPTLATIDAEIMRQVEIAEANDDGITEEVRRLAADSNLAPKTGEAALRETVSLHSPNIQKAIAVAEAGEAKARERAATEAQPLSSETENEESTGEVAEGSIIERAPIPITGQDFIDALEEERAADRMGTYPSTSPEVFRPIKKTTIAEAKRNAARYVAEHRERTSHERHRNGRV